MNNILIYGASGHGKVVCDILTANNAVEQIIFIDDAVKGNVFYGKPLYIAKEYLTKSKMIIAIGNNQIRKQIASKYTDFYTAVHKSAIISSSVIIGKGTVVMPNVSCNADVKIGNHVILNTSCSIDHDCTISDYVHISPNVSLAGNVKVGEGTHIGIGACVIQGVKIGKNVIVGAGAVILKDIPDNVTVVGNPGRIIK